MRTGNTLGQQGGACRLHRYDPDVGIFLFQISAGAGNRTAGAYAGNEDVYLPIGVCPDLRACGGFMGGSVGRIVKLSGDKASGQLGSQFVGFINGTLHALGTFCQHQLSAVGSHQKPPFHTHRVGHDNDDLIAPAGCHRGETDTGVS